MLGFISTVACPHNQAWQGHHQLAWAHSQAWAASVLGAEVGMAAAAAAGMPPAQAHHKAAAAAGMGAERLVCVPLQPNSTVTSRVRPRGRAMLLIPLGSMQGARRAVACFTRIQVQCSLDYADSNHNTRALCVLKHQVLSQGSVPNSSKHTNYTHTHTK